MAGKLFRATKTEMPSDLMPFISDVLAGGAGLLESADCVKVCGDVGEVVRRLVETLTDGDVLLVVGGPAEVMSQLVQCIRDSWCADLVPQAVALAGDWMTATSYPTFTS